MAHSKCVPAAPSIKQENVIGFIESLTEARFTGGTRKDAFAFIAEHWEEAQRVYDELGPTTSGFLAGDMARESIPDDSWAYDGREAPEIY